MYDKRSLRRSTVVATLTALAMSSGCVLVIGNEATPGRGNVEWSPRTDEAAVVEPSRVDSTLAGEVAARFEADSALAGEDITVASSGDVVTLHGRVSDLLRLENALRIASETPGVARVVSRVTVEMEVN
ncbi:BON domain-containing protein [Wenzhouxiangella sp. XN24]|uniref:BON domain-containing protein n=1 Tax=Wenzhouxiangella sp. XN24 TaxID=2713569 RepID=UPI0013EBE32B|nr:BON domain-containing protein [Wenzhouxiangella sp. XN24]NGX17283.1 BON domain-containing protein [Wenzhouxiangella sp. XN24]